MANNYDTIYAEDFFQYLKNIQNSIKYTPSIQPIPSGAPTIDVNLNTREIAIEKSEYYKDFLSMREDHRAETVYFKVDRHFEDVDLNNCTCVVQYMNLGAPTGKAKLRFYPITLKDLETFKKEDKMVLAWNLGGEATEYSGTLLFSLIFYKVNNTGDKFLYALHTIPAQGTVLHGMDYTDNQGLESEVYYSLSEEHFNSLRSMIDNKNVYWNDV